ncbi:MAG: MBL fold metallo-hydrolase, partial [Luteibaculum sp.]
DHIFGALILSEQYSLPFEVPENDLSTFRQASQSAAMFGLSGFEVPEPQPGLKEGKDQLGAVSFDILLTPGHSVGHVVFVFHEKKWVIGGDVLFQGSIGRTDLPGGDFDTLERSIKNKLYPLPDDYTVYCGHGPETTIGWEKKNNPFVRA